MDDISTWRARIGLYCIRLRSRGLKNRSPRSSVPKGGLYSDGTGTLIVVLGLLYIAVILSSLLILSGDVELNPGPGNTPDKETGEGSILSLANLKDVINQLWDARTEWFQMGVNLGLKPVDLKAIEMKHRASPDLSFQDMLEFWLKNTENPTTWKDLSNALHNVGMVRMATEIERKYNIIPLKEIGTIVEDHVEHLISSVREIFHLPMDDWFEVGLKLQLSQETLKQIERDYSQHERRKSEMLSRWFQSHPDASYEELIKALASTGNKSVAEELCSKQGIPAELAKNEFISSCVIEYARYLKEMYLSEPIMQEDPWPPPPSEKFTELTLILKTKNGNDSDKQIDLKNIFNSLEKPFKILVDGDPGSGKSTLCRKIVHNWSKEKMAQDFNLTILVPLRDPEIVNSNRIDDLFYHDDSALQMKVVEHVRKNQGANVLLIFDGYDELSHKQRTKHSLFLQILQGKKLAKCSVLVTSRPHASQKIESLHTLSQYVKLLGFSKRDIMSCISSSIHGEKGKKLQYLLRFEKLELLKVCENPLSCAIIIFVYKQGKYDLPITLTGNYEYFISNVLTREADIQGIECKSMLEPDLLNLCKLAYENNVNDRVVLEDEEVRKLIDPYSKSLGLLTASKGFMSRGRKLNYTFTHLTVQEYLAAKWIHETLSPMDASNFLACNVMEDRLRYTLLFLAGQSKLHHQCYEHVICDKQLDLCTFEETTDHKAFVTKIMLIYEAQNTVLCPLLSSMIKGQVLKIMVSGLNEKLSASLAFFIDKSCCTWAVVNFMLIHSNFVQFVRNFKSTNKLTTVKSLVLNHQPIFTDYGCCTINDINRLLYQHAFRNVNSLSVTSPVDEKECTDLYVLDEQFSAKVLRMLIMMGTIRHLSLQGVVGATNDILQLHDLIADSMNCLESLDIKSSQHSLKIIMALGLATFRRFQAMKSLSLQVVLPSETEHDIGTTLENVIGNFFYLDSLILRSYCNTKDIYGLTSSPTLSKFLYGIAINRTLQRVTLGDMDLDPKGVSYILQNNHTLQTFNLIFVELTKELIFSLSTGLKKNKSLRNLCLIAFQDRTIGLTFSLLSSAFTDAFSHLSVDNYSEINMKANPTPDYNTNPYHLLLDSIVNSKLQSVILDFQPGKFLHNSAEFFKHLIRMLIKDKTLTRFTLNELYYSEEHLAEIARALVLNGKRNEIDFTLGNSLRPTIYSRTIHTPMSEMVGNRPRGDDELPIVQDQELLIQQNVDEFKEIMLKNMLKTLVFILAIRKQKQDKILEQLSFDLLTYSILKVFYKRIHRQTVFLDMWKETRMLRSLLNTLSFILMLRKQRQQVFLDTLRYHVMYIPE